MLISSKLLHWTECYVCCNSVVADTKKGWILEGIFKFFAKLLVLEVTACFGP